MNINFQEIAKSMQNILLGIFDANKPAVQAAIQGYLADAETRLTDLATRAISGELAYSFVIKRLKEETVNIKDILLSTGEIIGADVQDVANKAVAIFQNAVNDTIEITG